MIGDLLGERSAVLSDDGLYRYRLDRIWDAGAGSRVLFVMLNPSTADATGDDPTIRRCIDFARRWGHAGLTVVNLYAYRSTDPWMLERKLNGAGGFPRVDIVGPENDQHIAQAADECPTRVVAWGARRQPIPARPRTVYGLLRPDGTGAVYCLGDTTKDGSPKHPLYVKGDTPLQRWEP